MHIVRFETNIPQEITLKRAAGVEREGRYGNQFMHSLDPDGIVYLEPIVEEKLAAAGVRDGDTVAITKKEKKVGNKKTIEWVVEKMQQPDTYNPAAAATVQTRPLPSQPNLNATNTESNTSNASMPAAPDRGSRMGKVLAGALVASIDALVTARAYAESKHISINIAIAFTAEDLRCMANTAVIQYFREQENNLKYGHAPAADGGGKWAQ